MYMTVKIIMFGVNLVLDWFMEFQIFDNVRSFIYNVYVLDIKPTRARFAGKVTSKLLMGRPGEVILSEAAQGAFDLIVIGGRELGGFKEFVLGSVSHQVVNESKIPVLVVK